MTDFRVIATIGPVSNNPQTLRSFHAAGMSIARLNGSHGNQEWHTNTVNLLRDILPDVPILLDIPGRKIRTLQLVHEPSFLRGERVILTTDSSHNGEVKVPVSYDKLHEKLSPGIEIFADDGTLSFVVEKIEGRDIYLLADMNGTLKSRKGINVPGLDLGQSLVNDSDRSMIAFAKSIGVDYIGISFVESAEHIGAIRSLIDASTPKIVAKIENGGGLKNLLEVVDAADVIMIDRGDLAVETSINHVAFYQKKILRTANKAGKPTIIATEMLHNMIGNLLPTKAEVSDITNAVLDGASAVMLSGETAIGHYPVEAVKRISDIASLAATYLVSPDFDQLRPTQSGIRLAISTLVKALPISKLIVLSQTGYSVRIAAMSGTGLPIVAIGSNPFVTRSWNLLPSVSSVTIDNLTFTFKFDEDYIIYTLIGSGLISESDYIILFNTQRDDTSLNGNFLRTLNIKAWLKDASTRRKQN